MVENRKSDPSLVDSESVEKNSSNSDTRSSSSTESSISTMVIARGTEEGLVLRLDGRLNQDQIITALRNFIASREGFINPGSSVVIEWLSQVPAPETVNIIEHEMSSNLKLVLSDSRLFVKKVSNKKGGSARQSNSSLFGGFKVLPGSGKGKSLAEESATSVGESDVTEESSSKFVAPSPNASYGSRVRAYLSSISKEPTPEATTSTESVVEPPRAEERSRDVTETRPDAHIIYGTLRSGQKVESEHSVVIFGDVNSGAEVCSAGDIIILGTLRGIAHAGAFVEDGGERRVIVALSVKASQLRIGSVITRGQSSFASPTSRSIGSGGSSEEYGRPEMARVADQNIIVENYSSKVIWDMVRFDEACS